LGHDVLDRRLGQAGLGVVDLFDVQLPIAQGTPRVTAAGSRALPVEGRHDDRVHDRAGGARYRLRRLRTAPAPAASIWATKASASRRGSASWMAIGAMAIRPLSSWSDLPVASRS